MKSNKKRKKTNKKPEKKTRKVMRKEQRQSKKVKKNAFFSQKKIKQVWPKSNGSTVNLDEDQLAVKPIKKTPEQLALEKEQKAAAKERKLEKKLHLSRVKQLEQANIEEDKLIKKLEKNLQINRRKSKSVPKSFVLDGLDYLLDICDHDKLAEAAASENIHDSDSEFEDDFAVITGKHTIGKLTSKHEQSKDSKDKSRSGKQKSEESIDTEEPLSKGSKMKKKKKAISINTDEPIDKGSKKKRKQEFSNQDTEETLDEDIKKKKKTKTISVETEETIVKGSKKKRKQEISTQDKAKPSNLKRKATEDKVNNTKTSKKKKVHFELSDSESVDEQDWDDSFIGDDREDEELQDEVNEAEEKQEEWEDIYGRRRAKTGEVMPTTKYVPPHLRGSSGTNTRLRAQLKGLLNRLSENNMKKIADELESLYMSNSRHDTSDTLSQLLMESLIAGHAVTPDRLVAEHVMLIAILHANVGTEVGAHMLQAFVTRFSTDSALSPPVEDKRLDNLVLTIAHLYNFRVVASELIYDVLTKLAEKFSEKEVGLILLVLKTVGASLRRDNPSLLKDLISRLQTQAGSVADLANKDNTRVRFLLDVVLAIKNNNMSKIPGYDVAHAEHLKKTVRVFLRPGNSVTELKISLLDLLKAETQGRWWVVGSAWLGNEVKPNDKPATASTTTSFSAQVLALARKQRMNTEVRRNIFCIVMTAEDYLDAFEKLLRLGLKNQQQREIVNVLLDCCLQEKEFNAYYVHLACKFCSFDRKYQVAMQYLLWDKLKEVESLTKPQMTNLAKFLTHLFLEPQGLPLSVLKVIHFAKVDKPTVRLLRQTMLGLLLADSEEACSAAFTRIAGVEKLRQFREGLRLFLHHFVLRQTKQLKPDDLERLQQRTKLADQALCMADGNTLF